MLGVLGAGLGSRVWLQEAGFRVPMCLDSWLKVRVVELYSSGNSPRFERGPPDVNMLTEQ